MDNKNFYFYISGFISLFIFVFFSSLFIISIVISKKVDSFALKKDNYISVSVDIPKTQSSTSKKNIEKPIVEEPIKEEPIVEKQNVQTQTTKVEKKEINIDNLFSDVWTKSIKAEEKKPKTDNRIIEEIQKKINKSDTNTVKSISKKIQNIDAAKMENENAKESTAPEVNEYFAKIQALVYEHFTPPENSEGNSVVAVIELSAMGKVIDFRILTYSGNDALNIESDKIKSRIVNILFPENPNKSSGIYKIKLISKE
ncbi:MAG: hypothetical protein A2513_08525 [Sulfurimonas sp. RIFOXYD12_FULL_33_39]|uniref:TonB C-terminal domain-containing protein n=1 Tax=unclassified Sulfurimonas TaxID=2623549 RepID=UPI0008B08DFA|nr:MULTISPECIES: TonB C-terminal domain-containing protein [unclassified Sulfurimonas]OHE10128.1 MAG: hypothetical protein A2513_08525 [Sulfurimonas sp. RIFOXYD12_FULL_33_39]OHE14651.1 MAG: hypothetical protein A2530_01955 [Sulfurimonas sp. RIFOXYD2_FULL_34_21]